MTIFDYFCYCFYGILFDKLLDVIFVEFMDGLIVKFVVIVYVDV